MKQLIFMLTITVVYPAALMGCDKTSTEVHQAQKQKQQEEADKRALRGEFKKSQGKSY